MKKINYESLLALLRTILLAASGAYGIEAKDWAKAICPWRLTEAQITEAVAFLPANIGEDPTLVLSKMMKQLGLNAPSTFAACTAILNNLTSIKTAGPAPITTPDLRLICQQTIMLTDTSPGPSMAGVFGEAQMAFDNSVIDMQAQRQMKRFPEYHRGNCCWRLS